MADLARKHGMGIPHAALVSVASASSFIEELKARPLVYSQAASSTDQALSGPFRASGPSTGPSAAELSQLKVEMVGPGVVPGAGQARHEAGPEAGASLAQDANIVSCGDTGMSSGDASGHAQDKYVHVSGTEEPGPGPAQELLHRPGQVSGEGGEVASRIGERADGI